MANIGIINDEGEREERRVFSKTANISAENVEPFQPSVVQRLKYDHKGQMSSITTECGETENRREGDNKPNITVEGVITKDELGPMKSLKEREEISFVSDLYEGRVVIDRLSITQTPDLLYYKEEGGEKKLAFEFQMQVKQPE